MLFADGNGAIPDPTPAQVGVWVLIAVAALTAISTAIQVILGWRKLTPTIAALPVTQEQFEKMSSGLTVFATKADTIHLEQSIKDLRENTEERIHRLEDGLWKRVHDLTNKMQPMVTRLVVIEMMVRMIARKSGIEVPEVKPSGLPEVPE